MLTRKPLELPVQILPIRPITLFSGEDDPLVVQLLQAILQHGTIDFCEDILSHVYRVVWINTNDAMIEGGMMNLAQGKPIGHLRNPCIICIGNDVRGIEQLPVSQVAHGAPLTICMDDHLPESALVQAVSVSTISYRLTSSDET